MQHDDPIRIYWSARWRHLRAQKLLRDPLCEDCAAMGITRPACVVDHRHAISQGGDPFPPLDELSSKCEQCHNAKTARGPEHGAVKTTKPRKGCDANGMPLDPNHAWNSPGGKVAVKNDAPRLPPPNKKTQLVLWRKRNG